MSSSEISEIIESLRAALTRLAVLEGKADPDEGPEPEVLAAADEVRHLATLFTQRLDWPGLFDDLDLENEPFGEDFGPEDRAAAPSIDAGETNLTVRARYDYGVLSAPALLEAAQAARAVTWEGDPHASDPVQDIGEAIYELFHAAGPPFTALAIEALRPGSGLLSIHRAERPLSPSDFSEETEPETLFAVGEEEELLHLLAEPMFDSREDAEHAARRDAGP